MHALIHRMAGQRQRLGQRRTTGRHQDALGRYAPGNHHLQRFAPLLHRKRGALARGAEQGHPLAAGAQAVQRMSCKFVVVDTQLGIQRREQGRPGAAKGVAIIEMRCGQS